MTLVTIVGAGLMTKPMVDYFLDRCGYKVIMLDKNTSNAEKIINGRVGGRIVQWTPDKTGVLNKAVAESDIVISMVPKQLHIYVAKSCLKNQKNMVTASYETPELIALNSEAKEKGILILNELGEDPGIDHFGTQMVLDKIRKKGARVVSVYSYGSSIPAFSSKDNPFGYKFAWDPRTFTLSSQTDAVYLKKGKKVKVPGNRLLKDPEILKIDGLGTFEVYPNKSVVKYLKPFGLDNNVSFFRGLLRHQGYCENIDKIIALGLFTHDAMHDFSGKTYRQFMASLIETNNIKNLESEIAKYLSIDKDSDFINNLRWLGLLSDEKVVVREGSTVDVVLNMMTEKMRYKPGGKDMIIIHIDVIGEGPEGSKLREKATMVVEGQPIEGDSAISRAVSLSVAISVKKILEGKIKAIGTHTPPTIPELYPLVLEELKEFGFEFKCKSYFEQD